jgi:hypothetical protein
MGKKKKRTSKKNVGGRRTSSHGNKTSTSRSVVKQKGMVFGFRKKATAVVGPEIEEEVYLLSTRRDKGSRQKNMKIGVFRNVTPCSVVEISNASKERDISVFRVQEKRP